MICPQCGETTVSPKQRFCHTCGAMLHATTDMVPAGNHVGDGSDYAMSAFAQHNAPRARPAPVGRLMMYGGGGAIVAIAVAIAAVIFVTTLITFLTAAAILAAIIAPVYLWLRFKLRRHRRWARF